MAYANLAGVEVGDRFPVRVVGVINVSPESFHAGSVARGRAAVQKLAVKMVSEGAAILDVGAMSTAPYRGGEIDVDEEVRRMCDAVRAVRAVVSVPISADTRRSRVAAAALAAGATIVNDVDGLRSDPDMAAVARDAGGLILMASEERASKQPIVAMVSALLRRSLARARAARVPAARIVLDPGIGFFRRARLPWYEVDCLLLRRLADLRTLGRPLLVGASRKSFLGRVCGHERAADRLFGSVAAAAIAAANGAALLRAHDVAATLDAVRVGEALRGAGPRGAPPPPYAAPR